MSHLLYSPFQPTLAPKLARQLSLRVQTCSVSPDLNSIVYRFIKLRTTKACPYLVIPDTSYALYFSSQCTLLSVGLKRPQALHLSANSEYYGIHFFPAALSYLFRRDFSEIAGDVSDACFLPADFIDRLQALFYTRASFQQKARLCENILRPYLLAAAEPSRQSKAMQIATTALYRCAGNMRIANLAEKTAYSERQLNRVFQQSTGLSSKTFAAIIRLQFLLRRTDGAVSLPSLLDHGYYDQSHYRKDYQRFLK